MEENGNLAADRESCVSEGHICYWWQQKGTLLSTDMINEHFRD